MFEEYYLEVRAIRITRKNYQQLKELDIADDILGECSFEDCEGDWFAEGTNGYELIPGNTTLIPRQ